MDKNHIRLIIKTMDVELIRMDKQTFFRNVIRSGFHDILTTEQVNQYADEAYEIFLDYEKALTNNHAEMFIQLDYKPEFKCRVYKRENW